MANEVTQSMGMWIGDKRITNYYIGSKPAVYTARFGQGPLTVQYIAVGGGQNGVAGNGGDGGAGGNGANWITSSLSVPLSSTLTITLASTAGGNTTIVGSTTITTANGTSNGVGGPQSTISTPAGAAGTGGIVWFNSIGYAGGGGSGGGRYGSVSYPGSAGINGGGQGGADPSPGQPGQRGGGGGGGYNSSNGGSAGTGAVVIRYSGIPQATGGTITQDGGYTYHTYSSNGTFTYS